MSKINKFISSISFFFRKSKVIEVTTKEEIITPVHFTDNVAKIYDLEGLVNYLKNASEDYAKNLEKQYQESTGKQVVTSLPRLEEVAKQEVFCKDLFDYLEKMYEENTLKLTHQNAKPMNSQNLKSFLNK